jgi:predicted NAD-dependent protein-ADP-ribosyltransferase YbiA (DUF1768 family)
MDNLVHHPLYKEAHTSTHVFFLTGPLSNWHPARFTTALPDGLAIHSGTVLRFCSNEQYMMASKAALFGDTTVFDAVMALLPQGMDIADNLVFEDLCIGAPSATHTWNALCRAHKELGRKVAGFVPGVWEQHARAFVAQGARAKFAQNPHLAAYLAERRGKLLVEGAHYDKIWGVALAWNDPRITDPANWKGTNWLGEILTDLGAETASPAA